MESTLSALASALLFTATGLAVFAALSHWVRSWKAPDLVVAAGLLGVAIIIAATMH